MTSSHSSLSVGQRGWRGCRGQALGMVQRFLCWLPAQKEEWRLESERTSSLLHLQGLAGPGAPRGPRWPLALPPSPGQELLWQLRCWPHGEDPGAETREGGSVAPPGQLSPGQVGASLPSQRPHTSQSMEDQDH